MKTLEDREEWLEQERAKVLAELWETDPTAAIAYEQLRLQYLAGVMGCTAVAENMQAVFNVEVAEGRFYGQD